MTLLSGVMVGAPAAQADPASPLSISNVDSPDPVASGTNLTYTITVVNTGGAKVDNVTLTDQVNGVGGIGVPPQLVLTSTRGSCGQSLNLVTCSAGSIEGGGSWTVTITGVATAPNGTTLNNTASVSGTKSAQTFTSAATATTLVSNGGGPGLPDLTIAKTGPTSVEVSSPMTYTLTINNIGTANAMGVTVVDTVPAGVSVITTEGTSLFSCGMSGQTMTCTGGAVNQGSNATITILATSPPTTGFITNTASVDPDNTIAELNEMNNTTAIVDTEVTAVPPPPALSIVKTDSPDPVNPGGTLTYEILVTNEGATRADDVTVVDGTHGLDASSITASQVISGGMIGTFGGCTVESTEVTCLIKRLDPDGTMTVTITGQVVASAGSTIINSATVAANISNTGFSNTDTTQTTVMPDVDLTIAGSDSPDPVCARSWPGAVPAPPVCRGGLTTTFVVGNSGVNPVEGVTVRYPLQLDTIFDSFMAPAFLGGCAVDADNVVTCTGGAIGAGTTTTITLVLVAPTTTGTISSTATVDPNNAIFEADETNNTDSVTTQVMTGIDLTVQKSDAIDPIATSGTETYTIIVDNLGTQDATNIHVQDALPAFTTFLSAVGDHGFACSHSDGIVDCFGGHVLGTASEFYPPLGVAGEDHATITVRVFAQPFEGAMHNEVWVDPLSQIPEADETNNVAFQDTDVGSGGADMGAFNQLTITKEQISPANPVARNAPVTYELTIGNDATDPAVGVAVRDFLPAGAQFVEATGTNEFWCTHLAGVVDCTGGTIPAGGSATITITAFAPDTPGTYTNQAIVDPDGAIPEGNEFDNEASVETIVENGGNGAFNDLRIDKVGTATTTPEGMIDYTLTVWNTGSDDALDVTVRDVLPAGTTFVSAEDAAPGTPGAFVCAHAGGVIDCTGATILAGVANARHIEIVAQAPNQNISLTNQAFVDPDNTIPEGDELNNSDTADTEVQSRINLTITKTGPNVATQSTVTDYVLRLVNEAPMGDPGQTAHGVEVIDPLPVGLIVLAWDAGPNNNFACQILQNPVNVLSCIGDLASGEDNAVEIVLTAFITAESGRSLDNEACVDPDNKIVEFDPPGETDNCSTHSSPLGEPPLRSPDLIVSKEVEESIATPGQTLHYGITVSNGGTADAIGPLTVRDMLPDGVTFVNAIATNGWTCSEEEPGVVTCHDPPAPEDGLDVGELAQIDIEVQVNSDVSLPLVNVAMADPASSDPLELDAEDETNLANNSATATTSVGGSGLDLAIVSIADNPDPVNREHELLYTIAAVNGGTDTATDVHVEIEVPTGVTVMGADGSNGFNCGDEVAGVIDCAGDLPGGGETVITVTAVVLLGAPDDLSLTAIIDPDNDFLETEEGNNAQTEVTTVSGDTCTSSPCVDLVAAQLVASADPVEPGDPLSFSLVIVNVGDSVAEILPAGPPLFRFDLFGNFTFDGRVSSNPAITCADNPDTIPGANLLTDCVGVLGPGEGVTVTIDLTVNGGDGVTAVGFADPEDEIMEFLESNNLILNTVTVNP